VTDLSAAEEIHPLDRAAWRAWLEQHHVDRREVWLVSWKKSTGKPGIPYREAVEEALCFGWVDGIPAPIDDQRTKRRYAVRKPGSPWTASNRDRVERMLELGLMRPAGLAAVERAKRDGSWTVYNEIESITIPGDLAAALDQLPQARRTFDSFPPSIRRDILEWIAQAAKPETRARRITNTASSAARGEMVKHSRVSRTTTDPGS
jgi:uncharacterized protein YdeI (YjbR/CyaY-like superfamily)